MERLEPILVAEAPDLVLVPGMWELDAGGDLTAVKLRIPVAHVESGLRSFDRTMPEEINRVVTDRIPISSSSIPRTRSTTSGARASPTTGSTSWATR